MRLLILLSAYFLLITPIHTQVLSNSNYQNNVQLANNNINISYPSSNDIFVSVKGMANVKADAHVAIFNITQVGKNTEEVHQLMNQRLDQIEAALKNIDIQNYYVDMLSFVPLYEYEVEKKVFSKSYNEVPIGFELKKNIHLQYKDANVINELVAICANAQVYDLASVNYFADDLAAVKKELMEKAKDVLDEKIAFISSITKPDTNQINRQYTDGFKVMYPMEMYNKYEAYNSMALNAKKTANVKQADKQTTAYYQPIMDKEFDFVINPIVSEPVIQVLYEIKLKLKPAQTTTAQPTKEYYLLSPDGELKRLSIDE